MTGTQIVVSYSELAQFRQCPLAHAIEYKQRWRQPDQEGTALSRGSLWHKVLETHYTSLKQTAKMGLGPTHRLQMAANAVTPLLHTNGTQTEDQELIGWMYSGYVDMYGVDGDWTILAIEYKTQVPLLDAQGEQSRFALKVKLDLVVRSKKTHKIWVWDHKTAADLTREQDLDLDDQFGLYVWALRQIGKQVEGSLHSVARTRRLKTKTQPLQERYARTMLYRSDVELTNLALDAWRAARVAYSEVNAVPYSSPDPRTCGWKCDLREVHLAARKGTPIETLLKDFGFEQGPAEIRRIGLEE